MATAASPTDTCEKTNTQNVGDVALEAAFPRSAICRMMDMEATLINGLVMFLLWNRMEYRRGCGRFITSGSRAEGLTLEDAWGHEDADDDLMWLYGGLIGVNVAGGQQPRGESCLEFCPKGCPSAYCKLQITDLHGLRKSETVFDDRWFDATCFEESDGVPWLNTYNMVRCMRDSYHSTRGDPVSGPAFQNGKCDFVNTLVCSDPHPDLHHEFRSRTRGPWPTADVINYLLQLPMLLVLVGHKLSPEFRLQARMSWSHLEYKLIKELPESVRQGYIAFKYVMKRFLKARRCQNEAADGRSKIGSYHFKSTFLHFLEKTPPSLITSPFDLFLNLSRELDQYLEVGKLPHYFLAQCDLLETVGDDEQHLARQVIKEILSDPLNALITSPTRPQQIYGMVCPDQFVVASQMVSADPTSEQSRKYLSELLACVDQRRQERSREQREADNKRKVSRRAEMTGLVEMLEQIKHI